MISPEKQRTAIVIGAGVGGVATAARLAKAGFKVTIVEKNDFTGGRCSLLHHEGYRFDQGPSLLLLPKLFQETFHDLDTSLEAEGVQLRKCEPNYNIWFGDGEPFELSTDASVMKREIEKWEGKGGFERFLQWQGEAHRHYEISVKEVLHRNFESILAFLRPSVLGSLLALHPFESIYSRASRYFWTERLRRVFTFATMYMGMSPFDAPGTYSLLQYTEWAEGIWYPIGGFHVVVQALVKICERLEVDIRLDAPVASVTTDSNGSMATGVLLESGEKLVADVVVVNADLVYAYKSLFPSQSHHYAHRLDQREQSCSSISFYWSLSQQVPQLHTHNIFLAKDYKQSFDAIFKDKSIPSEPSFYINVPSRVDPSAAPPGKDALVVLVPVGHLRTSRGPSSPSSVSDGLSPSQDWGQVVSSARQTIISTMTARLGIDINPLIIHESVNDPPSWETTFNLDKGSILGLSHSFWNVLAFRPSTRHRSIRSCYFVGASTHPGTGVPIVLAGSKITTEQILRDFGMEEPWRHQRRVARDEGVTQDKSTGELDRIRKPGYWSVWPMVVLLLVGWLWRAFDREAWSGRNARG